MIKSWQVEFRYNFWRGYYYLKKIRKLSLPHLENEFPNVLYIGANEMQDKTGFLQALNSVCGCVIPFTKENGGWGQYDSLEPQREKKNFQRLDEILSKSDVHIDIVIMQGWGTSFYANDINLLKEKYGFLVFNIDMDSRLIYRNIWCVFKQNPGIFGLHNCVDLALVTTREICEWYIKEGVPAIYFPLASSEQFYYPIDGVKKIYDVGFIGGNYGIRNELINFLVKRGINVETRGPGWKNGPIEFEKNNLFFNQCKIVLGIGNISYCKKFYNPKLRDYDVPMSGSVYVTNRTKELESDYLDGKEIFLYSSWDELVDLIKWILSKPKIIKEVGKAAYNRARRDHAYEIQLKRLFYKLATDKKM